MTIEDIYLVVLTIAVIMHVINDRRHL